MLSTTSRPAILVLTALVASAVIAEAQKTPKPAEQLEFGVKMAKRGLWSEALFRFDQANRMTPGDPKILNNLAVAYEAVGRFEDALATYELAIRAAPGNRELKRNYSQFLEFYQGFRPADETGGADTGKAEAGPSTSGEPNGG